MLNPLFRRIVNAPSWVAGMALCLPVLLVLMPGLVLRHGLGVVLWWSLAFMAIGMPLVIFGVTLTYTLRATPSKNLRRVHRSLGSAGVAQTGLILLFAILVAVLGVWAWTMFADMVIDVISGRGTRLQQTVHDLRLVVRPIIGNTDVATLKAGQLGSPLGGMLIIAVLLWLALHRGLTAWSKQVNWLLLILFSTLVLFAGLFAALAWHWSVAPFSLLPTVSVGHGEALFPLAVSSDVLSLLFVGCALGSAFVGQLLLQENRSKDVVATALWAGAGVLILVVLWLIIVGTALSLLSFVQADLQTSIGSVIEVIFVRLPMGLFAALGGGLFAEIVAMALMAWLGGVAFIAALLLLRTACFHVHRELRMPLEEVQTRVTIIGLLLILPFCTIGGPALWLAVVDGVRFVMLPLLLLWIWWGVEYHLGFDGLVDYLRSYSVVPISPLWQIYARFIMPAILLTYLAGGLAMAVGWHNGGFYWPRLLAILPLMVLMVYMWWFHRQESQR